MLKFPQGQNFKTFLECSHPKYIFYPRWWFVHDSIVEPLVFQFESIYFQQLKIFLRPPRFPFRFVLQKRRFHHSKRKRRNEFETGSLAEVLSSDANEYQNWKKVDIMLTKIVDIGKFWNLPKNKIWNDFFVIRTKIFPA